MNNEATNAFVGYSRVGYIFITLKSLLLKEGNIAIIHDKMNK